MEYLTPTDNTLVLLLHFNDNAEVAYFFGHPVCLLQSCGINSILGAAGITE